MAEYRGFAAFYDRLMGDPTSRIARVQDQVRRHLPKASSLLELGCGTGSILGGLGSGLALTGIDLSPEMLAIARGKVPSARLVQADFSTFILDHRFDVVICVFDTLNHLSSFSAWEATFARVAEHLAPEGLFLFDINTLGKLRRLAESPPWVHTFDGENTLIMAVSLDPNGLSTWDIKVFEFIEGDCFRLHRERINELGVELARVREALTKRFELLELTDPTGADASDESERAYFACRRRA
jgi:SAM-dependent methyltransferase